MANKIFMRHLAHLLNEKLRTLHAKIILLWHKNDIVSISVKRGSKRICHIASGFLDQIHVDGSIFDLNETNSYYAILSEIEAKLKLSS